MKIIHTSDLHLNSKIDKLSSNESKIRREELLCSFERLVDFAKKENIKAIIIAGDMFDTTKTSNKVFERVLFTIQNAFDVDFLYVAGNHEADSFISFIDKKPSNLFIFSNNWQYRRYGNVVISGINIDNDNSKVLYDTLNLNKDDINIITTHGQVAGYKNNENAEIISLPLLKDKNIDYLALGHYHTFADGIIDNRGKFVYSGCLEGRGFDETGEKGFVLIDTDEKLSYKFVPFASRCLYETRFDVNGYSSNNKLREDILFKLKNQYTDKSMIKVVLFGEHDSDFDIDIDGISTKLTDYFYYVKVKDETTLKINLKDFENDKSFKGEFIRATLSNSSLTDEEKNAIIIKGLKALKGEL